MTSWRTTGCTSKFPAHFPQSRDELWKNRAIICPIKSRGGPGVPPLRLKRTVLITGSVPLIRLAFGQPPTPFGLPLKGKARAGEDTRPYGTYKRLSGECRRGRRPRRPAGAQCAPLRLKRVALITKTAPLIRLAALGTFPQGKAFGRPQGSPLRHEMEQGRWFGKARRSCGTAPAFNFWTARAQWPGWNSDTHSDFARRKCFAHPKG